MSCLPNARALVGAALLACGLVTASAHAGWKYTDAHIWALSDNDQAYDWRWQDGKACADVSQDYAATPYKNRSDNTHRGIDIRDAIGTPVLAAAPGKVIATIENYWGSGRTVFVHHGATPEGNHLFTYYTHLDSITTDEREMVSRG